jgi:Domain of unknown function (DUF1707)
MLGAGDERRAGAVGRGHQRVSRMDRERVIELLKVAFVQDRLTQDELDTRVGLALASRTYAELADLTADIPAEPNVTERAAEPAGTPGRTLARAARRAEICILTALAFFGVVALTNAANLMGLAIFFMAAAAIAASGFLGYGVIDAWQQRRSRGQLPPRPRRDVLGGRPGSAGHHPALPQERPDQARADVLAHRARARASRGILPLPGAW